MKGNIFATTVFFMWPILCLYLFTKKNIRLAVFISIIGAALLLPVKYSVDLPFFPSMDKDSFPIVIVIIGLYFIRKVKISSFKDDKLLRYYICSIFLLSFFTVYNNQSPLVFDERVIPAMSTHDIFSTFIGKMLYILPFFIGARVFRTFEDQIVIFRCFVIAGLLYSLLVIVEIRLSPQLHTWVYGYNTGGFAQQKRDGGFRATVFMGHGLWVAFLIFITYFSSRLLINLKKNSSFVYSKGISFYLFIILFLSKTLASLIYGVFAFIALKHSAKWIVRYSFVIATIALSYPLLSMSGYFPHKSILKIAEAIDHNRAGSLEFRFDNEEILLDKAKEKLFFGWGGWGRNRVFDSSGKDLTVTDGRWIITMGGTGLIGFLLEFGLMMLVIAMSYKVVIKSEVSSSEKYMIAAHSLLVSIIMIDQIPNASLKPWVWLLIGSLYGRLCDISKKMENSKRAQLIDNKI